MKNKIIKTALISVTLLLGILSNTQAQSNIARIIPNGISFGEPIFDNSVIYVLTGEVLDYVYPDDPDSLCTFVEFDTSLWGKYTFLPYLDPISLRAFFVHKNNVFSWEKIKSGVYEELGSGSYYDLKPTVYLGIYTGTSRRYDEYDGCYPGDENYWRYPDPLFGWVKLKFNDDGSYTLEDCALGYKCKGIIIGTEELIVPTISYQVKDKTMTLTYSDSLYESADGQTWTKVTDAEKDGTYTVDISKNDMKLYCSIMDDAPSR
ncbi:MAG: hypothetical protein IKQ24_03990 [Verrucomicrobia bacterium]|nr:hypothetical protein [Verrucomicrobiota bacterium]